MGIELKRMNDATSGDDKRNGYIAFNFVVIEPQMTKISGID